MANDQNLQLAVRAVKASVIHLEENMPKFPNLGFLEAMQDPAFTGIRQAINPLTMPKENTLSWVTRGGRSIKVPKVEVTYKPQTIQTAISERTKPSTGQRLTDASKIDVYYDQHKEFTWQKTIMDELLEPSAQNYINALLSGKLTSGRMAGIDHLLSNLGYEMYGAIVPTIFKPANDWGITTAVAAIGKNKAFPTASSPTAAAPCVQVIGYDANGNPTRDSRNIIMDTILANQIMGKPIMIGGLKWAQWHRDIKDFRTNQDGLDFVAVYASLPWVFYYDGSIDTVYGEGKAILVDPAAVAFESVNYHGPKGSSALYAGVTKNENTYFERGAARFTQFKGNEPALSNTKGIMSLGFDLRIAEQQDTYDQPEQLITPSFSYGMYTRPTGFFTSDTGDVLNAVTGIYGFELISAS